MKSYKRIARFWIITSVWLGCLGAGALLVFEHPATNQPLPTTLYRAIGSAVQGTTAPVPGRRDFRPSVADRLRVVESYGRVPLSFEANRGQTDSRVKYLSRGRGYTLFLTGDEAVLTLKKSGARTSKFQIGNPKFGTPTGVPRPLEHFHK